VSAAVPLPSVRVLPLRDICWASVLSRRLDRSTVVPSPVRDRVVPARDRSWLSVLSRYGVRSTEPPSTRLSVLPARDRS